MEIQQDKVEGWHRVNRSKSKNQAGVAPKKGEGNKEARVIPLERTQETSKTKETNEVRDDSKESEAVLSNHQVKDQDEGATVIKEGENMGKSEEESESEEEEEEEGEIELTTPRLTKTKGRKSKKEVREQATYKDKLQVS